MTFSEMGVDDALRSPLGRTFDDDSDDDLDLDNPEAALFSAETAHLAVRLQNRRPARVDSIDNRPEGVLPVYVTIHRYVGGIGGKNVCRR